MSSLFCCSISFTGSTLCDKVGPLGGWEPSTCVLSTYVGLWGGGCRYDIIFNGVSVTCAVPAVSLTPKTAVNVLLLFFQF